MQFIAILLLLAAFSERTPAQSPEGNWQRVARDKWVNVSVERILYKKAQGDGFFIHVRIDNKTGRPLGVDLRDPFSVFYPNQWSIERQPARGVIDEVRAQRRDVAANALLEDFRDGRLTALSDRLEYFRGFDGKSPESSNGDPERYLLISMDGQLAFTDGKAIDVVSLEWRPLNAAQTDVVLSLPAKWDRVQAGALLVKARTP